MTPAEILALSTLCKALGHPVRLQILTILLAGERCVCHIEAALDKRQAYISQQLKFLREQGLVESRRDGLKVFYRIAEPKIFSFLAAGGIDSTTIAMEVLPACPCPDCVQEKLPI
jgi:ArsR family transcriptional regulator